MVFFTAHMNKRLTGAVGRYFIREILDLLANLVKRAPHQALDGENRTERVGDGLPLGHRAHQPLTIFIHGYNRWRGASTFGVGDHFRLATFNDRHHAVGCSQIYTYDLTHDFFPFLCFCQKSRSKPTGFSVRFIPTGSVKA